MTPTAPSDHVALRNTFVRPFYLSLLHANFRRPDRADGSGIRQAIVNAANTISDEQIERLLIEREWRGRLCAAWFIGLSKRTRFVNLIGKLLLASEMVYSGQGYCVALGLVGGEHCAGLLRSYLNAYLPLNGRVYNQNWAIGALAHIEAVPAPEFLDQALWRHGDYFMDPQNGIEEFSRIISYLYQNHMIHDAS